MSQLAPSVTRRELVTRAVASSRPVPRGDLVNTLEFEEQARRVLRPDVYAVIAGGDRRAFERMTLRPRMCVPVLDMNLGVRLFDEPHFAPILVGAVEHQRRFHPEGELATVRGASAARAAVVVSSRSSVPLSQLTAAAAAPVWLQVFADVATASAEMQRGADAGCRAICLTLGGLPADWKRIATLIGAARLPVLVKGVTTPAAAATAIAHGAGGIIASTYRGAARAGASGIVLSLPAIVAAAGKVPVLVDGGFRRGTDILKALALGARAVLVARPVMWGLAAYGADGVQAVVEMLQTELARYMAMCGRSSLASLDPALVRIHRRV